MVPKGSQLRGVIFDGRRLGEAVAESTMLDCIERVKSGRFDAVAEWLIGQLMSKGWGNSPRVQAAIDRFQGSKVDSLFLCALRLLFAYGVELDNRQVFDMLTECLKFGDPHGRCHYRMGICFQYGYGTEENLAKAITMYREGVRLEHGPSQCTLGAHLHNGIGVQRDLGEAKRLFMLAHRQGYPPATYNLGRLCGESSLLKIALYKEASARGHGLATDELKNLQEKDPSSVVPFGRWSPQSHVHRWVSDAMHREMLCLLMAKRHSDGLVNTLPMLVLLRVCFYIACRPEEFTASTKDFVVADDARRNWVAQREQGVMEGSLRSVERRVEDIETTVRLLSSQMLSVQQEMQGQISAMQQEMSAALDLITTIQSPCSESDQDRKRRRENLT